MKIGDLRRSGTKTADTRKRKGKLVVKHSPFLEKLQEQDSLEYDLDDALAEIDQLGKILRDKPTLVNLKTYKAAVRSFLKQVVNQVYDVEQRRFVDRQGRRRIYLLVAKIDSKLEQLAQVILSKQDKTIDLASKLDEIRGLLLDISY